MRPSALQGVIKTRDSLSLSAVLPILITHLFSDPELLSTYYEQCEAASTQLSGVLAIHGISSFYLFFKDERNWDFKNFEEFPNGAEGYQLSGYWLRAIHSLLRLFIDHKTFPRSSQQGLIAKRIASLKEAKTLEAIKTETGVSLKEVFEAVDVYCEGLKAIDDEVFEVLNEAADEVLAVIKDKYSK